MCHEYTEMDKGINGRIFKSNYRSPRTGTLTIYRTAESKGTGKRVRFDKMQVIFYEEDEGQLKRNQPRVRFDKNLLYFARERTED